MTLAEIEVMKGLEKYIVIFVGACLLGASALAAPATDPVEASCRILISDARLQAKAQLEALLISLYVEKDDVLGLKRFGPAGMKKVAEHFVMGIGDEQTTLANNADKLLDQSISLSRQGDPKAEEIETLRQATETKLAADMETRLKDFSGTQYTSRHEYNSYKHEVAFDSSLTALPFPEPGSALLSGVRTSIDVGDKSVTYEISLSRSDTPNTAELIGLGELDPRSAAKDERTIDTIRTKLYARKVGFLPKLCQKLALETAQDTPNPGPATFHPEPAPAPYHPSPEFVVYHPAPSPPPPRPHPVPMARPQPVPVPVHPPRPEPARSFYIPRPEPVPDQTVTAD
jgi:hypothetical protein